VTAEESERLGILDETVEELATLGRSDETVG